MPRRVRSPRATDRVFLSRYGRPYASFPKEAWRGAIERAGLSGRGLCPHSMRRTFATYFEGRDRDCQEILGHADIATTMIYRRAQNDRMRAGVMALDYGIETDERTQSVPTAEVGS